MTQLQNQFKKLQTFGCSLTLGDDISDKDKIWPSILSKKLNLQLENFGYSNASNQSIADKVVECIDYKALVIVSWTSQFRHQVFYNKDKIDYNILQYKQNKVVSCNEKLVPMPNAIKNLTNYQKFFIDEENYYKQFLQTVLWLQTFLKNNGVKFIFVYGNSMSTSFIKSNWNVKPQITKNLYQPNQLVKNYKFIKSISTKSFVDFYKPHKSFWETCISKNFELGITRHPLEKGHEYWAKYLHKKLAKQFNI